MRQGNPPLRTRGHGIGASVYPPTVTVPRTSQNSLRPRAVLGGRYGPWSSLNRSGFRGIAAHDNAGGRDTRHRSARRAAAGELAVVHPRVRGVHGVKCGLHVLADLIAGTPADPV